MGLESGIKRLCKSAYDKNGTNGYNVCVHREILRGSDRFAINVLPALTVGYQVALFPAQAGQGQNSLASQQLTAGLSWRLGPMLESEVTATTGRQRADSKSATPSTDILTASASLIWIIPWVFGTTYYDENYLKTQVQQGLGVGPVWSLQECRATGDARGSCPKKLIREMLLGIAIDMRISKDVSPRFTFGRRSFTEFKPGANGKSSSTEGGIQVVYTLK